MHRNTLLDLNNLVFITRFAKVKTPSKNGRKESHVTELIFKESMDRINRIAGDLGVNSIIVTCDSVKVWKKDIYPAYKSKDSDLDIYYKETLEAANMCKKFFTTCTNVPVMEVPRCEADDIIAVICQESTNVENVIVSSDRDFVQLTEIPNVRLYSPVQKIFRECEDAQFELFVKCIRGDINDNIKSAYPRVRMDRLKKAWNDDLEFLNLMETVNRNGEKVFDLFEFNRKLIDLTEQPAYIKSNISKEINSVFPRMFGELRIMKFFKDHGLEQFSNMMQYREKILKTKFILHG